MNGHILRLNMSLECGLSSWKWTEIQKNPHEKTDFQAANASELAFSRGTKSILPLSSIL